MTSHKVNLGYLPFCSGIIPTKDFLNDIMFVGTVKIGLGCFSHNFIVQINIKIILY